jgi:hypothetical protein
MRTKEKRTTVDIEVSLNNFSTFNTTFARKMLLNAKQCMLAAVSHGAPVMDQLHVPPGVAYALESSFSYSPYSPKRTGDDGVMGHANGFDIFMDRDMGPREFRLSVSPERRRDLRISAITEGLDNPITELWVDFTTNYDI